jgi:hypothetical protein
MEGRFGRVFGYSLIRIYSFNSEILYIIVINSKFDEIFENAQSGPVPQTATSQIAERRQGKHRPCANSQTLFQTQPTACQHVNLRAKTCPKIGGSVREVDIGVFVGIGS